MDWRSICPHRVCISMFQIYIYIYICVWTPYQKDMVHTVHACGLYRNVGTVRSRSVTELLNRRVVEGFANLDGVNKNQLGLTVAISRVLCVHHPRIGNKSKQSLAASLLSGPWPGPGGI